MGRKEKKAYLLAICKRYHKANRQTKSRILDEFCAVCGYNRKYAIRRLKSAYKFKNRGVASNKRRGPKPYYREEELLRPLKTIWFACDQMCSKYLKAALPRWLPFFEQHHGALSAEIRAKLLKMSPATIDRMLKPIRAKQRRGQSGTKPGTLLKNQIPIKTHHWDVSKPGFVEADTVALCGNSLSGEFVWCLTLTDIATTWTEIRAVWGKGSSGVIEQIKDIEASLCFDLLGFDCDNGSEFLNHHLLRYFHDRESPVKFTRSRPYKKNDNAHVEQKNWTHVRQVFGYDRYEKSAAIKPMNQMLSTSYSLFKNHFTPTSKLIHKERINSKYKKQYDKPKTPYERVLASPDIDQAEKDNLRDIHDKLDPFELKHQIYQALREITRYAILKKHWRTKI